MKITKISRTISYGDYQNLHMEAELCDQDNIQSSVDKLSEIMEQEIARISGKVADARKIESLNFEIENLKAHINSLADKRKRLLEWFKTHDVNTLEADLPF